MRLGKRHPGNVQQTSEKGCARWTPEVLLHAYIARFALVCRFQSIIRELRSSPPPKTSAWRDAIAHENSERMRGGKLNELCGLDLLPAPASRSAARAGHQGFYKQWFLPPKRSNASPASLKGFRKL